MMSAYLISLALASAGTGIAVLVLAISTPLLKKRFSARSLAALWLIATLGFLIPWRPAIAPLVRVNPPLAENGKWKMENGKLGVSTEVEETTAAPSATTGIMELPAANVTPVTVPPADSTSVAIPPADTMSVAVPSDDATSVTVPPLPPALRATPLREGGFSEEGFSGGDSAGSVFSRLSMGSCVLALWSLGFFVLIFRQIYYYVRFLRTVRRWSEPVTDEATLNIFDDLKRRMTIRRSIRLLRSESAASPLMFGLTRPTILLPKIAIPDEELAFVLRHELTHYVRRDLWVRTASFLAVALHWFNPCAWLTGRMVGQFSELACDEQVTETESADGRRAYVEAILGVIKARHRAATVLTTQFLGGEKGMKQRIFSIMEPAPNRSGRILLAATILFIVGAGMIFGVAQESPKGEMENGKGKIGSPDANGHLGLGSPDANGHLGLENEGDADTASVDLPTSAETAPSSLLEIRGKSDITPIVARAADPAHKQVMYPIRDLLTRKTSTEVLERLEAITGTQVSYFPLAAAVVVEGDDQIQQKIADQLAEWRQETKTEEVTEEKENIAGKTISYPFNALAEISLDPSKVIARLKTIHGVSIGYAPEFCRLLVTVSSNEAFQQVEEMLDTIRSENIDMLQAADRVRLDRAILEAEEKVERLNKINEKIPGSVFLEELDDSRSTVALRLFKKTGEKQYREQAIALEQRIYDRNQQLHEKGLLSEQEWEKTNFRYRVMTEWLVAIGEKYPDLARELIQVEYKPIPSQQLGNDSGAPPATPDTIPTNATPTLTPFYFRLNASGEEVQKRLEALDWENSTRSISTQKAPDKTLEVVIMADAKLRQKIEDALRDLRIETPAMISSEMVKILAKNYARGVPSSELDLRQLPPKLFIPGVQADYTPSIPLDTFPDGSTPVWEGTLGRDIWVESAQPYPQYNLAGEKIADQTPERFFAARVTADFVINALDGTLLAWREKSWPVDRDNVDRDILSPQAPNSLTQVEANERFKTGWKESGNEDYFDFCCEYKGVSKFNADWNYTVFTKDGYLLRGTGFSMGLQTRSLKSDHFNVPDGATEFIGQAKAIEMGKAVFPEVENALMVDCRLDCRNSRAGYALIFWWPKPVSVSRSVEGKEVKAKIQSTVLFLDAFTGEVISTCEDSGGPVSVLLVTLKGAPLANVLVECWLEADCVLCGTTGADGRLPIKEPGMMYTLPPHDLRVTIKKVGSDGKNELDPKYAERTVTPLVINGARESGLCKIEL